MTRLFLILFIILIIACNTFNIDEDSSTPSNMKSSENAYIFDEIIAIVDNEKLICTASMIGLKTVLTTASCTQKIKNKIASIKIEIQNQRAIITQKLKALDWIIPKDWDGKIGSKYDIALIYLDREIQDIKPLRLTGKSAIDQIGKTVKVVGFSSQNEKFIKKFVDFKISFASKDLIEIDTINGKILENCIADDGRALLVNENHQYFLNGIAFESAKGACQRGSHYINLFDHLNWIAKNTNRFVDGKRDINDLNDTKPKDQNDLEDIGLDHSIEDFNLIDSNQNLIDQGADLLDQALDFEIIDGELISEDNGLMCVPEAEICDGIDNDCNGTEDDHTQETQIKEIEYLSLENPDCIQRPNPTINFACNTAAADYCYNEFSCAQTSIGFVEVQSTQGIIVCMEAEVLPVSMIELQGIHSGCVSNQKASTHCNAARKRYCENRGAISGFGPVEDLDDQILVACIYYGILVSTNILELQNQHPQCTLATITGSNCKSAIHRFCARNGYRSGYGPVEIGAEIYVHCF